MSKKRPFFKMVKGVRHILVGEDYIPDIVEPMPANLWGKFVYARVQFLLNHRRDIFFQLKMEGRLIEHLEKIEDEASDMTKTIMDQMLKAEPIPKDLKSTDFMQWMGLMDNYRSSAEEFVWRDLIYSEGTLEEMEEEMEELEIPEFKKEEVFIPYDIEE